jgi:hypothetical protein
LRLAGVPGAADLLVEAPDDWPDWLIERHGRDPAPEVDFVDEDRASVALHPSGRLAIDRARAVASIEMTDPPGDGEVAHPYLAAIAAVAARWLGHIGLHAGGFLHDGRVWAVMGDSSSGKSSMLAWLAGAGHGVMADDLLVVAGGDVLAGPHCVDLRPDVAQALGRGSSIGTAGGRERWRVVTAPVPPTAPLAGFVTLDWGSATSAALVPSAQRLPLIADSLALALAPADPAAVLDLAALPMLALERPRSFEALPESGEALMQAIAGLSA